MSTSAMTRRSFLAGSAGAVALAGLSGYMGFGAWEQAHAAESAQSGGGTKSYTLCDGCGNQCGMAIWMKDGKPLRAMGMQGHPCSAGHLCGRGQGLPWLAYSGDRLTEPLKNDGNGKFEQISWDQAFSEIVDKLDDDPSKIATVQARGTDDFYTKRLMAVLGSPNYFSDGAFNDSDITAVIESISGAYPSPDPENAKYVVMLDKSSYDGFRPAEAAAYAGLRDKGARVVMVDPRLTGFSSCADEWLPVRPGTELAFLLGVAHEVVRMKGYSSDFVNNHANGFDDFARAVDAYTPEWAADMTGIDAYKISTVATNLVAAAPHCYVDLPWAGTFGCGYRNSADTVRMVLLLNAMLGNSNQPGGMIYGKTPYVADSMLDANVIKPVEKVQSYPVNAYDAMLNWGASAVGAVRGMVNGDIKSAILFETNPVRDFTDENEVTTGLKNLDLLVVCDTMMTETAQLADYVLPLTSYLERTDTIKTVAATTSVAAVRHPVVDKIHPDTKTVDEIVCGLGEACGKGDYFDFDIDDYNKQCAKIMGISYDALKKQAVTAIPKSQITYGSAPYYRTKSGKLDFKSDTFAQAGLSAVPEWVETQVTSEFGHPRLLSGEQLVHTHTCTVDDARLMNVSKDYNLDAAWINQDYADSIGVSDGDDVQITSDNGSITVRAKVTKCIHPEAVWIAPHYGCSSKDEKEAYGFGAPGKSIVSLGSEPGTGAAMVQETLVSVKKAGA